ncbi:acetyl-CoA acetyltransferase [Candidatus Heimdallarchaeota archaeon B3_Heim]|nr:MAG: acetyl-CoA acetyltransferase [Candidatus Heimdallarchaeota archaeon B3_Heim]
MKRNEVREVVVVEAIRLPTGKSSRAQMDKFGGYYRNSSSQDMLVSVLESLVDRVGVKSSDFDAHEIEDVQVGILSQIGDQGGNIARIAQLMARNIPDIVAGATVNRYCNAGLQAINTCANALKVGDGDIMIAAGVENLTHYSMGIDIQLGTFIDVEQIHAQFSNRMSDLQERMSFVQGESAEQVADKYKLTREDIDHFSLWSHQKATKGMRDKKEYEKRVVPIEVEIEHPDGSTEMRTVAEDQTIRDVCLDDPDIAWEQMKSLKPVFREGGKVTAGNSSQISDGASAVMLMAREKADELGLKPLVSILSTAVAGDDPQLMLTGPIPAMERALTRAGDLTIEDMHCIEPNEAFASPCLAFAKHFDYPFDDPRVNPYGGAIAIGHPIGSSGVQFFTNMVHYLVNTKQRYGIQTLCGGGGVGIATVVERTT